MAGHNSFLESTIRFALSDPMPVLSVSDSIETLLGFSPDSFLDGRISLKDRIHPDDQDIADELFSRTIQHSSGTFNLRLRQANGRIRCVKGEYQKTLDDSSQPVILELLLQDAKSLGQRLGNPPMMDNLRAVLENTDDYIYFKDRNHVFTGASQTLVSITDPARHWTDLLGQTDYDVFPEELADRYYRLEKQVFEGIPVAHEVQEILTTDGRKGWVDNRKYPIRDESGEIVGLFGVARDVTEKKRAEDDLLQEQQFTKSVLDNLPGIFYLYAYPENRLVLWNKRHESLLGYTAEEMAGRHVTDWHIPEAREAVLSAIETAMKTGQNSIEAPLLAKDGRRVDFALTGVRFEAQGRSYLMGTGVNISERKKIEEALRLSEERHRLLADNASDVIWTMNLDGRITYVSPSVEKLRGYTAEEVMRQSLAEILTPDSVPIASDGLGKISAAVKAGLPVPEFRVELEQPCRDGSTVWTEVTTTGMRNAAGEFIGILGVTRDITERKKMEEQVRQLAFHDPLTSLPNRRLLNDRLSQAMATSKRSACHGALMFLDLDNFKQLNDAQGHEVGDSLLIEVAARLKNCVREMDTVARFGGDEFVVMISELTADRVESITQASLIAEKIRIALAEPYRLKVKHDGEAETTIKYHCTASIGMTLFVGNESSQDDLLKWADMAMYQAKEAGRDAVRMATESAQRG